MNAKRLMESLILMDRKGISDIMYCGILIDVALTIVSNHSKEDLEVITSVAIDKIMRFKKEQGIQTN